MLLWVCQRYDLSPDAQPHPWTLPFNDAHERCRVEVSDTDSLLARLYWAGVWVEGGGGPFLSSLRQAVVTHVPTGIRGVALLTSDSDASAELSSSQFLPVSVLPGLLDGSVPQESRYGGLRQKARERTAFGLVKRLEQYPGNSLVVVGASGPTDLDTLLDYVGDLHLLDLKVTVVWPPDAPNPDLAQSDIDIELWRGRVDEFARTLAEQGARQVQETARWSVRIGDSSVTLDAHDVDHLASLAHLITEDDLREPETFRMEHLNAFLSGDLDHWAAFAAGLPVARGHVSADKQQSLTDEVVSICQSLAKRDSSNYLIEVPAHNGAGATTLLRQAAFAAASSGFPTLVVRPQQATIDPSRVAAFAQSLAKKTDELQAGSLPPLLVVFDVEHDTLPSHQLVGDALARQGRKAVLLRAVPIDGEALKPGRYERRLVMPALSGMASPEEVEACSIAFGAVKERWSLSINVPSLEAWGRYEAAMRNWRVFGARSTPAVSMFWVALRFFLTEGMDEPERADARAALASWIKKRADAITSSRMKQVIAYVAALSSMRIASPLWTVLRPAYGDTFTSELVPVLKQLNGLVQWRQDSEIEDQALWFLHPALAEEYLRLVGVETESERLDLLKPVLDGLSAGRPGDLWVAQWLVCAVVPAYEERSTADWDLKLSIFDMIPGPIRDGSRVIAHQWGRALYLSADPFLNPNLSRDERHARLLASVSHIQSALNVPRSGGRDEHPSHYQTSLGTAYARLAEFLWDGASANAAASDAWKSSFLAFERAGQVSSLGNPRTLLAYAQRKVDHAHLIAPTDPNGALAEAVEALGLLDHAEDLVSHLETPEQKFGSLSAARLRAWGLLDDDRSREYLTSLQTSGDRELGYVLEAMRVAHQSRRSEAALEVLRRGEIAGITYGHRGLRFRIHLMQTASPDHWNWNDLMEAYRQLNMLPGYQPTLLELFRYAVLCYQLEDFERGRLLFDQLKSTAARDGSSVVRLRDHWRDPADHARFRSGSMRVDSITNENIGRGHIYELKQDNVLFRPRHFRPLRTQVREVIACGIEFQVNGPLAVPTKFLEHRSPRPDPSHVA